MGEFYELKRKNGTRNEKRQHDADYWEKRCKASENEVLELQQALINSSMVISSMEAALSAVDAFLASIGLKTKNGESLSEVLKYHGIGVDLVRGKAPKVFSGVDTDMRSNPKGLKDIDGLELELSFAQGVRVGPHFK